MNRAGTFVLNRPDDNGVYVITTAKWPRGDRFTEDRDALYRDIRNGTAPGLAPITTMPLSPFVRLDGMA